MGAKLKLSAGYNNSANLPQQLMVRVGLEDIHAKLILFAAFDMT